MSNTLTPALQFKIDCLNLLQVKISESIIKNDEKKKDIGQELRIKKKLDR